MTDKDVYTTHEIGLLCHVHQTTVINWIKNKKLASYTTPGGHRRVRRQDLAKFLKQNNIPVQIGHQTQNNRHVLIIDDDMGSMHGLRDVLSQKGCQVDVAANAFEAGYKLALFRPGLIVMNFELPGLEAEAACQIIRKDADLTHIPIVGIGADPRIAVDLNISAVIRKPVQPQILLASCFRLLGMDEN